MKRLNRIVCFLLVSVFFLHCQKDVSFIGGPDTGAPVVITPDPINATLQGNVVDENNQPAPGVTITAGTKTAITDARGYFRLTGASLDKNNSLVVAEKAGYFKGYRVFAATSGANQVVIKMIKKTVVGTIAASAGGTAALPNGAKISLPVNGVVVASSGADYSGDVKVYASYIDPSNNDIGETVPGSFAGFDKSGKKVVLSSFGMLAVELESPGGEKLQVKSGSSATLTTPIPSASLSAAPATIAMWYVDEQTGLWKEEGAATKQGNNYVGDVKHFSFWNCDGRFEAVTLSLTLHNSSNNLPLANVLLKLTSTGTDTAVSVAYGFTDSLGQEKGLVPTNKNLLLEVIDPCGRTIYSEKISPITQNTDLGIITVTNTNSVLTIQGTLIDCNNVPVKNGYAIISIDNSIRYIATDGTGKFATTYITCYGTSATAQVIGVNAVTQQQSTSATITVVTPITNAGNITTCGLSAAQFVNYTLDGTDYSITSSANDSIMANSFSVGVNKITNIGGKQKVDGGNKLSFTVDSAAGTGTYPIRSLLIQNYNSIILTQPFNVVFTNYATTGGEFYEGSLSGKFTADSLSAIHNISATFRVRRS